MRGLAKQSRRRWRRFCRQGFEAEALEEVLQGFEGAVLEADSVALLEALRGVVGV